MRKLEVMSTITVKINERSKAGMLLKELIEMFSNKPGVEIVNEKSPYNPEFVKKVLESHKNDKRYEVKDVNKLWESL